AWRRKSTSPRAAVRIVQFSRAKRRRSADPTIPLWPATNTRFPASEYATGESFMAEAIGVFDSLEVRLDHFPNNLREPDLCPPAEALMSLAGIAKQGMHFGRPEIAGVNFDQ